MDSGSEGVGYGRPPRPTQFQKGRSGNPQGRPHNRRREIPYDAVLGQMVIIREDGRERRVTAAEAFLLQLTKRALEGDSSAARASLTAIEAARAVSQRDQPAITGIVSHYVSPGSVGTALDALGLAVKLNRYSEKGYYKLKPWIVQAALARLQEVRLTPEEQQIVLNATHQPAKVQWPGWWSTSPQVGRRAVIAAT
jgi:hypothetical protein